jgi:hypothetical protein
MYIRNQYTFNLPVQFSFLEPMDPVSLTDQWLGLSAYPVRIVSVEDADNDELTIIAEDFPVGISHSPLFNVQQGSGFSANFNADPGFADAPFVFEAPAEKTTTGLQIWIGCRPASPVTPNTLWGGCQVWVAMSAASPVYKLMGTVYANQIGSSRYGTLTGPIAGGALPIQLPGIVGQPSGQIGSGTLADMENNTSLIFVGGANPEYLSYETATPGSSGAFGQNYSLSPLQRGAYGTAGTVAHATSDPWILVDNTVIKSDNYDLSTMLGKTILIKLVSFNAFGSFGPSQSISNCTSASYTIQGYMAKLPPLPPSNAIAQAEPSGIRISWSPSPEQDVTLYELRQIPTGSAYTWANGVPLTNLGTLTPAQWLSAYGPSGTQVGGTSFFWAVQPSPGYTVLIAAVNPLGALAGAGQYSSTIAATVTVNLPTAVTGLTQQVVANELLLFWGPSTGGSLTIAGYQVWQGGTWSNATGTWVNTGGNLIGTNGPSTFTTWFGAVAVPTTYTFSVVPIDTAGNIGPPAYVVATIGTAPDYQLQSQYNTLFGGTKVNFVLDPIGYPTTTLNANDMAPGLTLTGQTVTVASLPSTWVGVRSYHGVNSSYESGVADANWYLEFTCNTQAGGWRCGLATLLVPLASSVGLGNDTGAGVHSFAYTQGGSILYDGTTLTSGLSALANGDIVGIAFNAAAGQVAFYRNGVLQYTTAITGGVAAGVYYPCISMSVVGNVGSANFGAQPFTYTVPTTFAGVSTPFGMIFPNPQDTTQGIFGPVDTTKSWTTHFTSNSWTTPQAQISAGYPIYAEPDTTGGTYEEVYDTGVTLSATTISVVLGTIALAGTVTITPLISWAPDNGSGRPGAWVSGTSGQYNTLATNFRFVRVTLTFSAAAGNNLLRISSMVTKLSIQQITDQGSATSGTSGNFTVTLNKTFVEITSIQITPQSGGGGTTTTYVGAAALPGANPTTFTGTIFDLTGTGKTGIAFNWLARGY